VATIEQSSACIAALLSSKITPRAQVAAIKQGIPSLIEALLTYINAGTALSARLHLLGEYARPERQQVMSIDIATALREEAEKAREVAERVSNAGDRKALSPLASRLVEIAERLERDARD